MCVKTAVVMLWCSAKRVVSMVDASQDQQVLRYEDKACQTTASSVRRAKLIKSLKRRSSHGRSSSLVTPPTVAGVKRLAASVCVSLCVSVCLFVCPHDKTKTAETKITKIGVWIVHHESSPTN